MTASVAGHHGLSGLHGTGQPSPTVGSGQPSRGRSFGVGAGQLVTTQIAGVILLIAAVNGTVALVVAAPFAVALLACTWVRLRGRWAYAWLGIALRFAGRRHTAVDGAPGALLQLVLPGARVERAELAGEPASVIVDGTGVTAVLELGDPAGLLAEGGTVLPSPASLLPPAGDEHPPVRIQLLLTGVPAPALGAGGSPPATSYRQLTEGRLLGHSRALLTVRVLSAEGFSEQDLRQALSGLVRKLPRRLGAARARPLGEAATVRVIAELAHDDHTPARETWTGLHTGGLTQATFRLQRWPDLRIETSRRLVSRLLALPAAATTVAVTAGPRGRLTGAAKAELTVRLAAPDGAGLSVATQALHNMLAGAEAHARRLDGQHLDGLAATLPLGGDPMSPLSGGLTGGGLTGGGLTGGGLIGGGLLSDLPGRAGEDTLPADQLEALELTVAVSGLMLGSNRRGDPVVARLFRPEQTRAMLVGGVRCAQLICLRAMALGARVVVQTSRPQVWSPFVRGAAAPGESIAVTPPGRAVETPPGSALHPLLVVVDVGPVGADTRSDTRSGGGFQATLVLRDDFGAGDVEVAARADLLMLQPLRPDEATLIGSVLGLGDAAQWLTQIRADMIGVVNRRAVRWAALAQTTIEAQLIGPPGRT